MNDLTYVMRVFEDGKEIAHYTCPTGVFPCAGQTMDVMQCKRLVLKVERKPNSGDFAPAPAEGEVWVHVKPADKQVSTEAANPV